MSLKITGKNTVTGYTAGHYWGPKMNSLYIVSSLVGVGFTNTQIDNMLIDLSECFLCVIWSLDLIIS